FPPLPPPPTSTLFPYTPLFRSLGAGDGADLPLPPLPVRELAEHRSSSSLPAGLRHRPGSLPEERLDLVELAGRPGDPLETVLGEDRKSTRLNSSHVSISYAVFC